jgi:hypothetical protein
MQILTGLGGHAWPASIESSRWDSNFIAISAVNVSPPGTQNFIIVNYAVSKVGGFLGCTTYSFQRAVDLGLCSGRVCVSTRYLSYSIFACLFIRVQYDNIDPTILFAETSGMSWPKWSRTKLAFVSRSVGFGACLELDAGIPFRRSLSSLTRPEARQ